LLTGANTYSGATTVSAGTLQVGNGGTTGTLGTGAVQVGIGAALRFNRSDNVVVGNAISGGGGVSQNGGGTTLLTGANTYSGATTVSAGTLQVGNGGTTGTLGSGAVQVGTGAALRFNRSDNIVVGNAISGGGGLRQNGGGTTLLTGANTYSGATTVSAGTLQVGNGGTTGTLGSAAVQVGTGAALSFNRSDNIAVGNNINGAGGVRQDSGGTLTLAGNNTFSGGLAVNAGSVAASAASALGTGNITLGGGQLTSTTSMTVANALSVSGGTTGTVAAAAGTTLSISASINLAASSTLRVGDAVNNGVVTLSGPGVVAVPSANLLVAGGTLRAGSAALGSITSSVASTTINAGATLDFSGPNLSSVVNNLQGAGTLRHDGGVVGINGGAFSGNLVGTMALVKQGTGTLALSGANTYSGGTSVSGGTLQGNATTLQGNINNNAAVTFDQAATDTYAGVMSGTGALTKQGAGNLILSGTNSYSGATNVNAGTLSANGSIANSAVTVNSGGTLGGNGTLGSTTIATGGVLAPGNSIGTLTVNGNLNFAAGSIYRVEVDAAGANDRINATGTATLNGGTVDVQAGAGTYAANRTYTILNAAAGRTGNFAGVTSNLAFLTPTLGYDANNVFLTLARNDVSFSAVAVTPNQIATSTALQNANGDATGDMSTVQTALTGLSAAQARAAYDSASGTGLVALRSTGASFAAGFGNQLQARLAAVGGANTQVGAFAGGPILLAANDRVSDLMAPVSDSPQKFSLAGGASSSSSSASSEGRGFWLRGSGGHQNTKSDSNAAASELRNSGISAGFDAELREGLVVGAALSSGTSRLGFDNNDTGKSSGSALAVYGSYASGLWAFKGSASAAWNSNHMNRAVTVGALNRTASSDFGSNTLSAYGEASYSLPMNGWTLQPLAALSLSRSKTDGFTETGAGALNLQVAGQTVTSTKSLLGAKASFDAGSVRLEPRVIWAHEFGDINTPMTAHFQGAATASPFQVSGVAPKRDTLILGLGASGRVGHGVDLFADVQFEHNQRQRNLSALMGVRVRW
ncbi:autotransporter domain-containing protein, partial [Polaromonas sp.]|uniref:autotransporter outer membrane beta-barrel domain-containing protein n=1 Tax=Polaromonas sp. TaxID=1869339 RepID=UPI0032659C11